MYDFITQIPDSVVSVRPVITGWSDAIRVIVLPAISTLLLGVVALLLEWMRRILITSSARTLVAAANAQVASDKATAVGKVLEAEAAKHWQQLEEIKNTGVETHHLVNAAAEKAQRQIDALVAQLHAAGITPVKGE